PGPGPRQAAAIRPLVARLPSTALRVDAPGADRRDRLERPAPPVVVDVEGESGDDGGGDPARADLVARERRAVDHDHVGSAPAQRPRAARSGGAAPDDDGVASAHGAPRSGPRVVQVVAGPGA